MGVGMPADLLLDEFGHQVWAGFGHMPYHVGSSLEGKQWRDVDVRLILSDEEYERMGLGDPGYPHHNEKWVSLVLAYSALGKAMTGLPIDFQIQQQTDANYRFDKPRSALGTIPLRLKRCSVGRGGSMTRLAKIEIVKTGNDWGDLQPGQMSPVQGSSKPDLWMVCCPMCGNLGELRTHQVVEHEDGTVTVSPSLVCHGSIYKDRNSYEPCTAHYFIERNQIRWC